MKLSSKNGYPFMIFEIISRTVCPLRGGLRALQYRACAAACLTTCLQGDLLMTSLQEMPVRLLDADEHASAVGACQKLAFALYAASPPCALVKARRE